MPTITGAPAHADGRLRLLLRLNATFSAVSGVVAVLFADRVARAIEIDATWLVRAIGFGLVVYAIDLLAVATLRPTLLVPLGRAASLADAAWVLGTVVLVATGAASNDGAALLILVAAPVAAFGIGQWRAAAGVW